MSAPITLNDSAQALADSVGTRAGLLTYSGKPLSPLCTDVAEGVKIDEGLYSRGRRWSIADDVDWSPAAMHEFRALRDGGIEPASSAKKTGVDLRKYANLSEFRQALCDGDSDKLARALTPARVDEGPSLFMASELTIMMPEIIKVARVRPYARDVLPMRYLNAPGAKWYRFNVLDDYGDAQWTSNFDGTPPVVGTDRRSILRPLEYIWMMARWGLRELLEWAQARSNGTTLPDFAKERPMLAREAILRRENDWLFFGGPTGSHILGLLSVDPNAPTVSLQGIQITNSANWADLTAENNMKLIMDAVTRITIDGVEVPTTILMSIGQYNFYASLQWPNTDKFFLGVLMENLKPMGITEIVAVPELTYRVALENKLLAKKYDADTARRYAGGINGKDVMVVLSRRQDKVAGIVAQDVRSLPPEVRDVETTVKQILSSGGCEVRAPAAHQIITFNAEV